MTNIVELVSFKLADNVQEEDFLKAVGDTTKFLQSQPGFQRRSLSVNDDGVWTDHVEWASLQEAQAAAAIFPKQEHLMPFMMSIDPASMVMAHNVQKHLSS